MKRRMIPAALVAAFGILTLLSLASAQERVPVNDLRATPAVAQVKEPLPPPKGGVVVPGVVAPPCLAPHAPHCCPPPVWKVCVPVPEIKKIPNVSYASVHKDVIFRPFPPCCCRHPCRQR